jgi:protein-disulfide isomerase
MKNEIIPIKKWYQKWWGLLLIGFGSLFLIFFTATGFYVYHQVRFLQANGGILLPNSAETQKIYDAEGTMPNYWFGSSNPKIIIVEFVDFSCPNSKSFNEKLRRASIKYYNDIKIVHRDFPVISDSSEDLAMAGRCAGEQGLFWLMNDELFKNQGITAQNEIYGLAQKINADMDKFQTCFTTKKYKTSIQKDLADGVGMEITGTPTIFVNGHKIQGDAPEDSFLRLIDSLINEK